MTFLLGIGVGVLLTVGYALLSVASDADDAIDNEYNKD
jgi:xanthosine utilization system XapX-like protein